MGDTKSSTNWAQIASAGSSILGSVWDTAFQNKTIQKTVDMNKELADYAYGQDLNMWEKQNQYNNPSAQMARLKEAGLNPNMVYGTGTVTGNTGGTMPKYNAPTADFRGQKNPLSALTALSAYQDIELKGAQTNLVREQAQNTAEKTNSEKLVQLLTAAKTDLTDTQYKKLLNEYFAESESITDEDGKTNTVLGHTKKADYQYSKSKAEKEKANAELQRQMADFFATGSKGNLIAKFLPLLRLLTK